MSDESLAMKNTPVSELPLLVRNNLHVFERFHELSSHILLRKL